MCKMIKLFICFCICVNTVQFGSGFYTNLKKSMKIGQYDERYDLGEYVFRVRHKI